MVADPQIGRCEIEESQGGRIKVLIEDAKDPDGFCVVYLTPRMLAVLREGLEEAFKISARLTPTDRFPGVKVCV
jgi:hypothetical protein